MLAEILAHFWGSLDVKAPQYNKRKKGCTWFFKFSFSVFSCQAQTFGSFRSHKPQNTGTSPETTDTPSVIRHFTSEFQHLSFGKTWKTSHLMPKFGDQMWSEEGEKKKNILIYSTSFCASTMQQPQMLSIWTQYPQFSNSQLLFSFKSLRIHLFWDKWVRFDLNYRKIKKKDIKKNNKRRRRRRRRGVVTRITLTGKAAYEWKRGLNAA